MHDMMVSNLIPTLRDCVLGAAAICELLTIRLKGETSSKGNNGQLQIWRNLVSYDQTVELPQEILRRLQRCSPGSRGGARFHEEDDVETVGQEPRL